MNMVIFPWQTITYSNQKLYINVPIKTLKPHNTDLMLTEENLYSRKPARKYTHYIHLLS